MYVVQIQRNIIRIETIKYHSTVCGVPFSPSLSLSLSHSSYAERILQEFDVITMFNVSSQKRIMTVKQ